MKTKFLFFASLLVISCNINKKTVEPLVVSDESLNKKIHEKKPTTLDIYDFEGLKPFLEKNDNKIHVVNFWATWCAPCVKELPYFEELTKKHKNNEIEVLLVSLDFPHQFESKLKPFLKEKNLKSKVVVLDDVDSNSWIPKVSKEWSGAIPATIIYKGNKRQFYEQSFTKNELKNAIQEFLN